MKVNGRWWATLVGLLVLVASSSALAGSVAAKPRFQNSYVCVNLHDGLIKVISRRQHNRCATGWKRYKVSDIFGKGMRGAQGTPGPRGTAGPAGAAGAQGPQGFMGLQGLIGPSGPQGNIGPMGLLGPQGLAGLNGTNGQDGEKGATGPQGPAGSDGLNGSSVVTATDTSTVVDANAVVSATAVCPAGHIAISGGFLEAGATSPSVVESHATPAFAGWVAKAKTQGNAQQSVSLTVYAYCVLSS
jgi:hypothetical protein